MPLPSGLRLSCQARNRGASSLYPSIIIAKNISPEVTSPFDEKGIIPKVVEEYLKQRKVYKEKYKKTGNITDFSAQWAYKILANSLYGCLKNPGFRLGIIVFYDH